MFKFVFICLTLCSCINVSPRHPSSGAECSTVFVVSEDCIIQSNSCNNPVKSKEDFDKRCKTEENMMFPKQN